MGSALKTDGSSPASIFAAGKIMFVAGAVDPWPRRTDASTLGTEGNFEKCGTKTYVVINNRSKSGSYVLRFMDLF